MPETSSPASHYRLIVKSIPFVIFFLALGLRLIGIGWGLKSELHNQSYHPDEPVIFGFSRAIEPAKGQFTPGFYNYGTLYLTVLRVACDITTTYTGGPKGPGPGWNWQDPEATDWDWVSRCHLAGRFISALAGAGTALVLFLMMRRFIGHVGAGIAGLVLAIAPAHLVHSRFQTVDVLAVFFLACATLYALKLLPDEDTTPSAQEGLKFAALCGVFTGLSAGTKYTGVLAILSLFTVLALAKRGTWLKEALAGVLAALIVFILATPGVILDTAKFMQDFTYEMQHTATGHGILFANTPGGFLFHLLNLGFGIGPLLAILGVIGFIIACVKKHKWAFVLLAFFLPYYLLIGRAEVKFARYSFPLYIATAAGFGYLIVSGHRRKGWGHVAVGAGILAVGGIPYGGLSRAVVETVSMVREDPRDEAIRYLRAQQPEEVGLAKDPWFWSVPLFPNAPAQRAVPWEIRRQLMEANSRPSASYVTTTPDGNPTSFSPALISDLAPAVIAYTSLELGPLPRLAGAKGLVGDVQVQVNEFEQFSKLLMDNYELEKVFPGAPGEVEDLQYTHPTVWIWRRK